jgi:P-type E1-E2 ATPase
LNGTLTVDGEIDPEVVYLIDLLKNTYNFEIHILTAATRGYPDEIATKLGAEVLLVKGNEVEAKKKIVEDLGAEFVCAIGNGANDVGMLEAAALGICVLQAEGAHPQALLHSDVLVTDIKDALRLLLHPQRLKATLRC